MLCDQYTLTLVVRLADHMNWSH